MAAAETEALIAPPMATTQQSGWSKKKQNGLIIVLVGVLGVAGVVKGRS